MFFAFNTAARLRPRFQFLGFLAEADVAVLLFPKGCRAKDAAFDTLQQFAYTAPGA
jgi:hypothetical protein